MKVNRNVVPSMSEEILNKNHEFWSQYSERLIGNWINYETSIKEIVAFVEKTYLHRNFSGFQGDRKFIRDDQAQKSFSKLRSAQAGLYIWRLGPDCPPELRPKSDAEFQRILREAEFASRQAFAFCPYSPEAVFNYVNLLVRLQRIDDATLIVAACQKLDPFNGQVNRVLSDLRNMKQGGERTDPARQTLEQLERAVAASPGDVQAALNLAGAYLQNQDTNQALRALGGILNQPAVDARALRVLVEAYSSFGNDDGVQRSGEKLRAIFAANPADSQAGIGLAEALSRLQQRTSALQVLDLVLHNPNVSSNAVLEVAQQCAALGDLQRVEAALQKLTQVAPELPEAWYDLAAMEATLGRSPETIAALRKAFALSARRLTVNPKARDLVDAAQREPRFEAVRRTPEFQQLLKK